MLSKLAQEFNELGKKALIGDEDALVAFIDLYKEEYVDNLDYAELTEIESDILFLLHTAGDLCVIKARTRDEPGLRKSS